MKILITILGALLITTICYLCTSFVCWELNLSKWNWSARFICEIVAILSNYFWLIYMERFDK